MALGGKNSDWRHGTNGAVSVLTDFTTKTMSVTLSAEAETVESTVFGDSYRDFEQSFKNATIEVQYKYDATLYGQLAAIYNAGDVVNFQLSPDGTGSTNPKITGSGFITSFGFPVEVGSLLVMDVSFQVSGTLTFGTHS
jgi:hypothetical protein